MLERTALRCSLLAYLLFFSIGSSNLWSQLTASPTLTTNFGNGSTVIACSSDTLEYSVQANPVDPNTVLNYRYVLHRNGANSYFTTHTVSATATQNDFSQNVQDGDRVFAEVYAVSATSTPTFLAKTQSFTVYFVNTPQVSITHSAQTESNTAVFCPGQTTTITVTPLQFQQGTNQYEFFVNSLSKQGPSTDNVFAYEFTENATLTVRVSNACVLEESISFKSNEVTPGSISITSSNSIGSTVSASHSGGLTGLASISYEWESSFDNTNWNRVLMANAPSLTNITINQATYFRRVAISSYGNAQCKSFSNAVLMTLMFDETIAQTSQGFCEGGPLPKLTVIETSTPTILSYQWLQSHDNGNTFTNIPYATEASYQPTNTNSTTYFKRQSTHQGGLTVDSSVYIARIIDLDPGSLDIIQNTTLCYNEVPTLLSSGGGGKMPTVLMEVLHTNGNNPLIMSHGFLFLGQLAHNTNLIR